MSPASAASGSTGIAAYGAYVPMTRLPLAAIAGRKAKEGGPEKAVIDGHLDAFDG